MYENIFNENDMLRLQNLIAKEKHHHAHHDDAQAQYFAQINWFDGHA